MKKYLLLLVSIGLLVALVSAVSATETKKEAKNKYVGLSSCKSCHSSAKIGGEEFKGFEKSAHAKAFATLKTDAAKKIGKEKGIADPSTSEKCLGCHTTAYGKKDLQGEKFKKEDGVTCEACHGPGENYLKMNVMKDHALSLKNGLVVPDEKTCKTCHNEKSPTFKGFKYAEAWAKIKHGAAK